jgi:hypothetical protein
LIASWWLPEKAVNTSSPAQGWRGCRAAGALLVGLDDLVHARQVELRVDALAVEVHGHGDEVHVAGALAVAEQRALDAIGAGQHAQLRRGHGTAAIVVRVQGDDHAVAARAT